MSWWVSLVENPNTERDHPVTVPSFQEGGTFAMNGSTEASLNITYNYSNFYYEHLNKDSGIRWLNEQQALNVIPMLEKAVAELGTEVDPDYWKKTPGNAGKALAILLQWALDNPKAYFIVQ